MRTCTEDDCDVALAEHIGRGRPRLRCAKHLATRVAAQERSRQKAYRDSPTRICSRIECGRHVRAHGLCSTHYNQTNPNRHRKITVQCASCGVDTLKDVGRDKTYATLYCSDLCKNYHRFGGCSSTIPTDHWARWYGATSKWVPRTYAVECTWCGARKVSHSSAVKYCSGTCKGRHARAVRRGRERGAVGDYTWMDVTRLWVAFDRSCAYCSRPTPLADIQAEHVVALSKGGANNKTNLLPSCGPCNSDKRDLTLSAWAKDRERRGLPPVTTQWSHADPRYSHLVTEWTYLRLAA